MIDIKSQHEFKAETFLGDLYISDFSFFCIANWCDTPFPRKKLKKRGVIFKRYMKKTKTNNLQTVFSTSAYINCQ